MGVVSVFGCYPINPKVLILVCVEVSVGDFAQTYQRTTHVVVLILVCVEVSVGD